MTGLTHEKTVQVANEIFAALKQRKDLLALDEATRRLRSHPESDYAELQDFGRDVLSVVAIERLIGNADCFAIADVLLRSINRQWSLNTQQGEAP